MQAARAGGSRGEQKRRKKTLRETSRENKVVSHNQLLLWMRAAAAFDLLDL